MTDQPAFLKHLQSEDKLPSPRGPALQVLRLTQQESSSLEALAHAISADPVLTGRLLKAANAVRPVGQRPVAALRDAVRLLGFSAVRGLALGFCLLNDYRQGPCPGFDYQKFWSGSLLRGLALQAVCQEVRVIPVEEAFSLGLLVRIGDLALASGVPEAYGELLTLPRSIRAQKERSRFGMDSAGLSQAMLTDWGLPPVLTDPVAWQDQPDQAPFREGSRPWNLLQAITLASAIVEVCQAEEADRRSMVAGLLMQGARLSMSPEHLPDLVDRVVADWQDWAGLFQVPAGDLPPFAQIAQPTALLETGGDPMQETGGQTRLRVLVVDDEASLRGFLRALLEQLGFQVIDAPDGASALEIAATQPLDLVVSDWLMPGIDGLELTRRLRQSENGKTLFILLLTQLSDDDKLVEAFAAGVDDFIGKPLKPRVFAARLRAARRVITLRREVERDRINFQRCAADFAATHRRLQTLAHSDPLTGLPHRQQGIALLHQAVGQARQEQKPLHCILVTLPSLGPINHKLGRQAGDRLLTQIAQMLSAGLRPGDRICRYGDKSFLITCPDTAPPQAQLAARRMAAVVEKQCEPVEARPRVRLCALENGMADEDALLDALENSPPLGAA
ncbi:HDOD domain-containing protein [Azovibrio restrictus]|uniref:HDOD domain-containing protein n=1 Tax=Azovibrio restrictus TaxID=146938 RepID=UPI0026EBD945|nr:HDOD domain-containing protein [Azovibrio restrictus]